MTGSRAGKRGESGLVQTGEIPLMKTLAKKFAPPTKAQLALIEAAVAIREEPDAAERAFMARQLVQCTLPHSNPGNMPLWKRSSGNMTLAIQPGIELIQRNPSATPTARFRACCCSGLLRKPYRPKAAALCWGAALRLHAAVGLDPSGGGSAATTNG